jgi:hypothetical protein
LIKRTSAEPTVPADDRAQEGVHCSEMHHL